MRKIAIFLFFMLTNSSVQADESKIKDTDIFKPNQTSASLLISYAKKLKQQAETIDKNDAEKKYLLTYDIYIKARSYALLTLTRNPDSLNILRKNHAERNWKV